MPNPKAQVSSPTVSSAKLDRKLRLSLPEKEKSSSAAGARRNTISEDRLPKRKKSKAPVTPAILEVEDETAERDPVIQIVNEKVLNRTSSTTSKKSAMSSQSTRSTFTYDNEAFEGNLKSISETRSASRTPSVRSLEVYREQYCCCAKRTKCERYLLVTVTILSIMVIVLVIVIVFISKNGKNGKLDNYKMFKVNL